MLVKILLTSERLSDYFKRLNNQMAKISGKTHQDVKLDKR